jgi:hypothetical protein
LNSELYLVVIKQNFSLCLNRHKTEHQDHGMAECIMLFSLVAYYVVV